MIDWQAIWPGGAARITAPSAITASPVGRMRDRWRTDPPSGRFWLREPRRHLYQRSRGARITFGKRGGGTGSVVAPAAGQPPGAVAEQDGHAPHVPGPAHGRAGGQLAEHEPVEERQARPQHHPLVLVRPPVRPRVAGAEEVEVVPQVG